MGSLGAPWDARLEVGPTMGPKVVERGRKVGRQRGRASHVCTPSWLEGQQAAPYLVQLHEYGHCVEIHSWILVGKTNKQMGSSSLGLWEQG